MAEGHAQGYDGVINDYYLVNADNFIPSGSLGAEMLRAENITGFRWWSLGELRAYRGHAIFAPRDMEALLAKLTRQGPPTEPLTIGL